MEESLGQEPRQQDETQHTWPDSGHHEMLAIFGGDVGGCLHDALVRDPKISLIKETKESSNTPRGKP